MSVFSTILTRFAIYTDYNVSNWQLAILWQPILTRPLNYELHTFYDLWHLLSIWISIFRISDINYSRLQLIFANTTSTTLCRTLIAFIHGNRWYHYSPYMSDYMLILAFASFKNWIDRSLRNSLAKTSVQTELRVVLQQNSDILYPYTVLLTLPSRLLYMHV